MLWDRKTKAPSAVCDEVLSLRNIKRWNSFMGEIRKTMNFEVSRVIFLSFIKKLPRDQDTIFTSLSHACENTVRIGQKFTFVTYDQPLHNKARSVVLEHPNGLSNVIVRLGAFQMVLSFLTCIGKLIDGSGLKEALSLIYARNTAETMLHRHAYSRAV